jgi:hypothetical protein
MTTSKNSDINESIVRLDKFAPKFISYLGYKTISFLGYNHIFYVNSSDVYPLWKLHKIMFCASKYIPPEHFDKTNVEDQILTLNCHHRWNMKDHYSGPEKIYNGSYWTDSIVPWTAAEEISNTLDQLHLSHRSFTSKIEMETYLLGRYQALKKARIDEFTNKTSIKKD